MSEPMSASMSEPMSVSASAIGAWLADALGPAWSSVELTRLAGGHSSGAWRIDCVGGAAPGSLVLKAPELPSVVYQRDAAREGRIVEALAERGVPVPRVVAIDAGGQACGRPCFAMELVAGRALSDTAPGSYHQDEWFRTQPPEAQRAVWESFHDALACMHGVDAAEVPDALLGTGGTRAVLEHWRTSLLDAAPAAVVPRQLAALDWLAAHLPADADHRPAVCMGDARLVNCLLAGHEVAALVDFEVAYVGNPAADIGYSLFVDRQHRRGVGEALSGLPGPDATWARWAERTGRTVGDAATRAYWEAFGATIIVVTATRAMLQWGLATDTVEELNPLVAAWESAIASAAW